MTIEKQNIYSKFYLSDEWVIHIIEKGLIVFDTSALLSLYAYSDDARKQIFDVLSQGFNGRLWIPAHVYFEYLKNKDKVSNKPIGNYEALLSKEKKGKGPVAGITDTIEEIRDKSLENIKGKLKTLKESTSDNKKHPFLNQDIIGTFDESVVDFTNALNDFMRACSKFNEEVNADAENRIEEIRNKEDDVDAFVSRVFQIGREYNFSEVVNICKDGAIRYKENIPPGYMDAKEKEGIDKYGDLIIWKQILEKASFTNKCTDVILVTNDTKVDWWDQEYNAPRFELLWEFNSRTHGHSFWSCTTNEFLHIINSSDRFKQLNVSQRVISESDSLSTEEDVSEEAELFKIVLQKWLEMEYFLKLDSSLEIRQEWRVFGKVYVYTASSKYKEVTTIVVMNVIEKVTYANALHNLNNALSIKHYYDSFGKNYDYVQFIVGRNREATNEFERIMQQKPKLRKTFENRRMENTLLYLDNGTFEYVDANHPMG